MPVINLLILFDVMKVGYSDICTTIICMTSLVVMFVITLKTVSHKDGTQHIISGVSFSGQHKYFYF